MRGLVLSGGGVKGAYSVGALKKIAEDNPNLDYDLYAGVSVGALNAFFLAHHEKFCDGVLEMCKIWEGIEGDRSVWRKWVPWPPNVSWLGILRVFFQDGLYDTGPLQKMIDAHYDQEKLRSSKNKLRIGVVDKVTAQYIEFTERSSNLNKWVVASASFPFAFKSLLGKKGVYSDGGHMHMTPLATAIRAGCTEIDVVMTGPLNNISLLEKKNLHTLFQSGFRSLDIIINAIWENDMRFCNLINQFVKEGATLGKFREIHVRVFAPKQTLNYDSLSFDKENIRDLMGEGYKAEGVPLEEFMKGVPEVTPPRQ